MFSPHILIVALPIEWRGKTITIDVEVVDVPANYNYILGRSWIHVIMAIVSSKSRDIRFPHWGNIIMIDLLDCFIPKTAVQLNFPFIRNALNKDDFKNNPPPPFICIIMGESS